MKLRGRAEKLKVYNLLGNKCVKCGFDDPRALQVDHINGGGKKDIRNNSGYMRYRKIMNDPLAKEHYQILCANCNWIKRHENKEC